MDENERDFLNYFNKRHFNPTKKVGSTVSIKLIYSVNIDVDLATASDKSVNCLKYIVQRRIMGEMSNHNPDNYTEYLRVTLQFIPRGQNFFVTLVFVFT